MISDKERREVAENLRQFLSVPYDERGWDRTDLQTVGRLIGTPIGGNIIERLADLIDRPTCRNLAVKPADEFLCSKCGEHVDIAYVDSCDDYHAKYCPNCGAVIADD